MSNGVDWPDAEHALNELIRVHNLENRIRTIQAVTDNGLFSLT